VAHKRKIAVIAFGGNQIAPVGVGENPNITLQFRQTQLTANILAELFRHYPDYSWIITHGNGPQVGNRLLRSEVAASTGKVFPAPLVICGADTQGGIAYMIQQCLGRTFKEKGIKKIISGIVTQVVVDKDDEAFKNPTKYVGPGYTQEEIERDFKVIKFSKKGLLGKPQYWVTYEDGQEAILRLYKGEIFRRVVPSPKPIDIVEFSAVVALIESGIIPITVGGGGIPVIKSNGGYQGVEAVIDKDLATALLVKMLLRRYKKIGSAIIDFIILTSIDTVYLNFEQPHQEKLSRLNIKEAQKYLKEGHFFPGSMGPKIEAGINSLRAGARRVIITNPEYLSEAMKEKAGTVMKR